MLLRLGPRRAAQATASVCSAARYLAQPRLPRPSAGSLQLHTFPLQAAWLAEGIGCVCATESPTGLRAAAAHLWKTGGVLGFFQGYKATVTRDVPYTMMELGQSFPCDHESIVSARDPPQCVGMSPGAELGICPSPTAFVMSHLCLASLPCVSGALSNPQPHIVSPSVPPLPINFIPSVPSLPIRPSPLSLSNPHFWLFQLLPLMLLFPVEHK